MSRIESQCMQKNLFILVWTFLSLAYMAFHKLIMLLHENTLFSVRQLYTRTSYDIHRVVRITPAVLNYRLGIKTKSFPRLSLSFQQNFFSSL